MNILIAGVDGYLDYPLTILPPAGVTRFMELVNYFPTCREASCFIEEAC